MTNGDARAQRVVKAGRTPMDWAIGLVGADDALYRMAQRQLQKGSADLTLPNGERRRFEGSEPGPHAVLEINRWRALRRMATGSTGFGRSYMDGDWDSPDLVSVIEIASANRHSMGQTLRGSGLVRAFYRLRHLLRENTGLGARRNIEFHYDLGNEFYEPWLDETMTYSAGIFAAGDNSLEAAQRRKYRRLLDLLGARPGDHILEIGSGWGGFAELAAAERGCEVTGLTLSREQLAFARERIARAGLADKVRFKLQDYRRESGRYDHVASIEMFEAVGERYWPVFFQTVRNSLKPGGRAALQIITIEDDLFAGYRNSADFIQTYIFPGGMLPSVSALKREVADAGLALKGMAGFADSYAQTLALWRRRFLSAFDAGRLPAGFDARFRRLWEFYLAYCEGAFRGGSIDVMQVALARD